MAEAHEIVVAHGGAPAAGLPPLDAIENEDWGRDYLLSRLHELGPEALDRLGLERPGVI